MEEQMIGLVDRLAPTHAEGCEGTTVGYVPCNDCPRCEADYYLKRERIRRLASGWPGFCQAEVEWVSKALLFMLETHPE